MKIGSFVGEKHLEIDNVTRERARDFFVDCLIRTGFTIVKIEDDGDKEDNEDKKTIVPSYYVRCWVKEGNFFNKRDNYWGNNGVVITPLKYIELGVTYKEGYDEKGKDKGAVLTSYSFTGTTGAMIKGYRCHWNNSCTFLGKGHYMYNTEIGDATLLVDIHKWLLSLKEGKALGVDRIPEGRIPKHIMERVRTRGESPLSRVVWTEGDMSIEELRGESHD